MPAVLLKLGSLLLQLTVTTHAFVHGPPCVVQSSLRCGRVLLASPRPPDGVPLQPLPRNRPRKLSGAFLPEDDNAPSLTDEDARGQNDEGSDAPVEWSNKATTVSERFQDPGYRERVLTKRRATLQKKGKAPRRKEERPPLSAAGQIKSDKMKLMVDDEEAWMTQRLAAGAERRSLLNNPQLKRQKQLERAETARLRAAKRKAKLTDSPVEK